MAGTHLCSGKAVLAGVWRPDQSGKKMETNRGETLCPEPGVRQTILGEALGLPLTV